MELTQRFDSTVGLLTNSIELNQSRHRGHSERAADIAVFIGRKVKLTQDSIENLRIAARLHELGIVSLPRDETVEEALDEGKSRHRTSHPMVADMLLKGFAGFEPVAELIRHMHENVDGSGKPDGLVLASDIYSQSGINLLRKGTVLDQDMAVNILKFNNLDPVEGQVQVKL